MRFGSSLRFLFALALHTAVLLPSALASCPAAEVLVYSPFTPVSQALYTNLTGSTDNGCWWWAICLFAQADEARKQQFSAVALVMGLIPLTLKDLAWPERRIIVVSRKLSTFSDILVRALGLVPVVTDGIDQVADPRSLLAYRWVKSKARHLGVLRVVFLCLSIFGLLLTYASLAVIETYSKRSSLGCTYPIFVVSWHLVALGPAALMTLFAPGDVKNGDLQGTVTLSPTDAEEGGAGTAPEEEETPNNRTRGPIAGEAVADLSLAGGSSSASTIQIHKPARHDPNTVNRRKSDGLLPPHSTLQRGPKKTVNDQIKMEGSSAIQGRGMVWPIQFTWAVYYITGTLIYSSIMAVTVIELFVWVVASISAAFMSKAVGVAICTFYE